MRFDEALSSGEDTLFPFEYLLHVRTMQFRCLLCESRVNKYLSYLRGQSWSFVKKGLEPLVKDGCLKYLWDDRKNMNKGERRHMFDFLAKAGATGLLALYVKYFRAEY